MRARPAAVMATRWSRLRGEFYLARKSDGGEVTDVEEHTEVLWLGGIGPRHSVEVDFWLGGFGVPAELRRAEEAKEWRNGAASASGRRGVASRRGWTCQGIHGTWPACSSERRWVAPRGIVFLNWSATFTERFLKTRFKDHGR